MTRQQIAILMIAGMFVSCAAIALCSAVAVALGILIAVSEAPMYTPTRNVPELGSSTAPTLRAARSSHTATPPASDEDSGSASSAELGAQAAQTRPSGSSARIETAPAETAEIAPRGPTARLSPTPGPSPTQAAEQLVEDWSRFDTADSLEEALSENEGWADNELVVEPADFLASGATPGVQRDAGVAMTFAISAPEPNDYVGFEWNLDSIQDWSGFSELSLLARASGADGSQLVVQFHEFSGEVWRHRMPLADATDGASISLEPARWEWADWSERDDLEMSLDRVTRMGIFVGHAGPAQGRLVFGPISLREP